MPKKLTTKDFVERARLKWGDRFGYDETVYVSMYEKITVRCLEHGLFEITPKNFLGGSRHGCNECANESMRRRFRQSTSEFIERAVQVHGARYDYSTAKYKNANSPVSIVCRKHGQFIQRASHHLKGHSCPRCSGVGRYTTERYVETARSVHGNRYDYSRVRYKHKNQMIEIGCPSHGFFKMRAGNHIHQASGCQKCANEVRNDSTRLDTRAFVEKSRRLHGDKYDYSEAQYVDAHTHVTVVCPTHGRFQITPAVHANRGGGCKKCGDRDRGARMRLGIDVFIERSREAHGGRYDYSKVRYVTKSDKVVIICPEHGEFVQEANAHMRGVGCASCAAYGFDPKAPAVLYYVRVDDRSFGPLYKIGITNRDVLKRFELSDREKISVLRTWHFDRGRDARIREQEILKEYSRQRYDGPDVLVAGNSELFRTDVLQLDDSAVD